MSGNLDDLAVAFGVNEKDTGRVTCHRPSGGITNEFERKLKRLGQKWHDILNLVGPHDYTSASEADMAVVDRMVKCGFTEMEIWETLERSARFSDRCQRKGERHARNLYRNEIDKAFRDVTPFPPDTEPVFTLTSSKNGNGSSNGKHNEGSDKVRDLESAPEPEPTPDAAYRPFTSESSFITRYVRYATMRTDAPAEAHELMAVTALSALVGLEMRLPIATSYRGWNLAIWSMYVVNSTVGRKTTTINLAREIVREVLGSDCEILWEGSPQGFIQRLQERDGRTSVFARDEYSALVQQINRGGHMSGLAQVLIRAYDGDTIENIRTKKKTSDGDAEKDTDRVENPYFVTLAASTRDSLIQRATIDNVLDGFLARFAFVTGAATPRPLGKITAAILAARDELVAHARAFRQKCLTGSLDIDEDVLNAAWELEQAWLRDASSSAHAEAAGPSMKRLSETVLKTAALIAIDESDGEAFVTLDHFATAKAIGSRWKTCTLGIIESLGMTAFMRDTEAVRATIYAQPGISLSKLYRSHRKLRERDFEEILTILEKRELTECVYVAGERGRPKKSFYPFGLAPKFEESAA